jgi:divalent metal cation (Fe/Co/Zn/Cd) transporter
LSTIYGYGRAEDLAGLFVIAVITLSAVLAAWEAIDRLIHPRDVHNVWAVAGAAVIGFAGNELVAPLPHPRRAAHRLGGPGR